MASWKTLWLVASCLLLSGCANGHDSLSSDVQSLGFDESFELLVERRTGPEQCFAADCPAITRYYLSDQASEQACLDVEELLEGTDVSVDLILGEERCRYLGLIGSLRLDVRATDPITEVPPDDQTLNPFPVTDPHEAMVVVRATRDE
jgi:hypothetical protein